ncbi:MAG TPA: zinc ribbon domain-containing protein [Pyrinomonadaceae bacterium]|nr:zinc ribbon domain-containing protein [Pyrinomonadaceae bacterium]
MFCPQCGTDSAEGQHYCRSCGTNLKVVGKAVSLGDVISKSDGVPAKVKEIMSNIKIAHVTDEVSRAMEKMNTEIARGAAKERFKRRLRREKTAEERRERHITKGTIKFFTGTGLSIFLYFLFHGVVLKLDPDVVNKVPFDIESVVRLLWIIGLVPVMSGVGHIIAGLSIKARAQKESESPEHAPLRIDPEPSNASRYDPELTKVTIREPPASVTDRTTNILDRDPQWQK